MVLQFLALALLLSSTRGCIDCSSDDTNTNCFECVLMKLGPVEGKKTVVIAIKNDDDDDGPCLDKDQISWICCQGTDLNSNCDEVTCDGDDIGTDPYCSDVDRVEYVVDVGATELRVC